MTPVRLVSMTDVGVRLEHLSDLHLIWSFALDYLTAMPYRKETHIQQASELRIALDLLEKFMMTEYDCTAYAQVINNLPKPNHSITGDMT